MAKQRGGNRTVAIGIILVIVITGIVIGVLFATGVLGKKTSGGSSPPPPPPPPPGPKPKPSPLGPNVPNPYDGVPISVTLSNPQLGWEHGLNNIPYNIQYNMEYSPGGEFPSVNGDYTLVSNATLTFADGSTRTISKSDNNVFYMNNVPWQPFGGVLGRNQSPVKVDLNAYVTYQNDHGNTITGPVSNTISLNIPTNY